MRLMSNTIEVPVGGGAAGSRCSGGAPLSAPLLARCPKVADSPETGSGCPESLGDTGSPSRVLGGWRPARGWGRAGRGGPTWVLVVQVVHVGDEAIVGEQEAHAGQQHREVDGMVAVVGHRLIDR